jgi:hypothetical protein
MRKAVAAGTIEAAGDEFVVNAMPDPFDARDLEYRPRLQLLPDLEDVRAREVAHHVYHQAGQSCTGHAVATVVNIVNAHASIARGEAEPPRRVSPYMLYRLARRYDEFAGEADAGSSLRGALKGWFHHGVALEEHWNPDAEPELDDPMLVEQSRQCPLGAYYRVNKLRLDDVQSAITELRGVAVTAGTHDGWSAPVEVTKDGVTRSVIRRRAHHQERAGHAFVLVGYNEIGFLIQNSWGEAWGDGGFATLPYDDWLDSSWDAWVVRRGVPQTPFGTARTNRASESGRMITAPGLDLDRLSQHVVNLGNDGRLSRFGRFVSTPGQIERIFAEMAERHAEWEQGSQPGSEPERHVVIYAHGGLVDEAGGLETADKHLDWWLQNRIYPVYFAWQSGAVETLVNQIVDGLGGRLPAGGIGPDLVEAVDRMVESAAQRQFAWIWAEMKENAARASARVEPPIDWPADGALGTLTGQPGATLVVARLARYASEARQAGARLRVHLVGHSAGAVFLTPLVERLLEADLPVASLALMAPALTTTAFRVGLLARVADGIERFTTFALTDRQELDDACGAGGVTVYHKSLLYLVSRALERSVVGASEVPLVGMARFVEGELAGEIAARGGLCVLASEDGAFGRRSTATGHAGFDDDEATMTSVLARALGATRPDQIVAYSRSSRRTGAAGRPRIDALERAGWREVPLSAAKGPKRKRRTRRTTGFLGP